MPASKSVMQRFWLKVDRPKDGCWLWNRKPRKATGRVYFWNGIAMVSASRFSYESNVGPIPEGMYVCHKCDNPSCVRPDHLFLGTQADNMKDMVVKGRQCFHRGEENGRAKLNRLDVRCIRRVHNPKSPTLSARSLAKKLGVTESVIWSVLTGRKWSHVEGIATDEELVAWTGSVPAPLKDSDTPSVVVNIFLSGGRDCL